MVGRIILTVLVLVLCFSITQLIEQKVAPQHATSLVIKGVENGDLMADNQALARTEQNAQNLLNPVLYGISFGFLILIWIEPIKEWYKKANTPVNINSNG